MKWTKEAMFTVNLSNFFIPFQIIFPIYSEMDTSTGKLQKLIQDG